LGLALRGIASSAIDVSDGLLGDLGHILKQSQIGAVIDTSIAINLAANKAINTPTNSNLDVKNQLKNVLPYVLAGGDDYELAFTAAVSQRRAVQAAALASNTPVTRIGQIETDLGLRLINVQGQIVPNNFASFDHFK
jgi:thiamine-monophosphate kinase